MAPIKADVKIIKKNEESILKLVSVSVYSDKNGAFIGIDNNGDIREFRLNDNSKCKIEEWEVSCCNKDETISFSFSENKSALTFYENLISKKSGDLCSGPASKKIKIEEINEIAVTKSDTDKSDFKFLIPKASASKVSSSTSSRRSLSRSESIKTRNTSQCSNMSLTVALKYLGVENMDILVKDSETRSSTLLEGYVYYIRSPVALRKKVFLAIRTVYDSEKKWPSLFSKESTAKKYLYFMFFQISMYLKEFYDDQGLFMKAEYSQFKISKELFCDCDKGCNYKDENEVCRCKFQVFECMDCEKPIGAQPDFIFTNEKDRYLIIEAKSCCSDGALKQTMLYLTCSYQKMQESGVSFKVVYGFATTANFWKLVRYDGEKFKFTKNIELIYPKMLEEEENWIENSTEVIDAIYSILVKDLVPKQIENI